MAPRRSVTESSRNAACNDDQQSHDTSNIGSDETRITLRRTSKRGRNVSVETNEQTTKDDQVSKRTNSRHPKKATRLKAIRNPFLDMEACESQGDSQGNPIGNNRRGNGDDDDDDDEEENQDRYDSSFINDSDSDANAENDLEHSQMMAIRRKDIHVTPDKLLSKFKLKPLSEEAKLMYTQGAFDPPDEAEEREARLSGFIVSDDEEIVYDSDYKEYFSGDSDGKDGDEASSQMDASESEAVEQSRRVKPRRKNRDEIPLTQEVRALGIRKRRKRSDKILSAWSSPTASQSKTGGNPDTGSPYDVNTKRSNRRARLRKQMAIMSQAFTQAVENPRRLPSTEKSGLLNTTSISHAGVILDDENLDFDSVSIVDVSHNSELERLMAQYDHNSNVGSIPNNKNKHDESSTDSSTRNAKSTDSSSFSKSVASRDSHGALILVEDTSVESFKLRQQRILNQGKILEFRSPHTSSIYTAAPSIDGLAKSTLIDARSELLAMQSTPREQSRKLQSNRNVSGPTGTTLLTEESLLNHLSEKSILVDHIDSRKAPTHSTPKSSSVSKNSQSVRASQRSKPSQKDRTPVLRTRSQDVISNSAAVSVCNDKNTSSQNLNNNCNTTNGRGRETYHDLISDSARKLLYQEFVTSSQRHEKKTNPVDNVTSLDIEELEAFANAISQYSTSSSSLAQADDIQNHQMNIIDEVTNHSKQPKNTVNSSSTMHGGVSFSKSISTSDAGYLADISCSCNFSKSTGTNTTERISKTSNSEPKCPVTSQPDKVIALDSDDINFDDAQEQEKCGHSTQDLFQQDSAELDDSAEFMLIDKIANELIEAARTSSQQLRNAVQQQRRDHGEAQRNINSYPQLKVRDMNVTVPGHNPSSINNEKLQQDRQPTTRYHRI